MCTFCKVGKECFFHLFWQCPHVQEVITQLIEWCKKYIDDKVTYDCASCLILGFPNKALNNVFLIAKYYIYMQRLFKHNALWFPQLLKRVRNVYFKDFASF